MKKIVASMSLLLSCMTAPAFAGKTVQIPPTFQLNSVEHKVTHVTFWGGTKATNFIKANGGKIDVPAGTWNTVCLHRMISAKKALSSCGPMYKFIN